MQRRRPQATTNAQPASRSRRALAIGNITLLTLCREARGATHHTPRGRLVEMYVAQHLGTWQQVALDF